MSGFWKRLFKQGNSGGGSSATPTTKRTKHPVSFEHAGAEDEVIRLLTPAETEQVRTMFLTGPFLAKVGACFAADQSLNSGTLMVGQYWCDEAVDAVQGQVVWSELETPDLQAAAASVQDEDGPEPDDASDHVNLGGRAHWDMFDYKDAPECQWADNTFCISLFASFCVEGGHQDGDFLEFESPVALFRRTGPKTASMTFVGEMVRPWLDGVAFYYSSSDTDYTYDLAAFEKWATSARSR